MENDSQKETQQVKEPSIDINDIVSSLQKQVASLTEQLQSKTSMENKPQPLQQTAYVPHIELTESQSISKPLTHEQEVAEMNEAIEYLESQGKLGLIFDKPSDLSRTELGQWYLMKELCRRNNIPFDSTTTQQFNKIRTDAYNQIANSNLYI